MKWHASYGEDTNPAPHDVTVRDVYLWAKREGIIKRFPRKMKKGAYYSRQYFWKYHQKVRHFLIEYYSQFRR